MKSLKSLVSLLFLFGVLPSHASELVFEIYFPKTSPAVREYEANFFLDVYDLFYAAARDGLIKWHRSDSAVREIKLEKVAFDCDPKQRTLRLSFAATLQQAELKEISEAFLNAAGDVQQKRLVKAITEMEEKVKRLRQQVEAESDPIRRYLLMLIMDSHIPPHVNPGEAPPFPLRVVKSVANKAPEPTPGLVTPRAMELDSEMKRRGGNRYAARGAPRPVVARL